MILAVDPGINCCGVALFDEYPGARPGGLLRRAWLARPLLPGLGSPTIARCRAMASAVYRGLSAEEFQAVRVFVAEWPVIYPPRRREKKRLDPNIALVPLAGVQAAIAAHLLPAVECVQYLPRDWKGTADGDLFVKKIAARLRPEERDRFAPVADSLVHNVYDAAGLGLKYLGRLERRRFISRGTGAR